MEYALDLHRQCLLATWSPRGHYILTGIHVLGGSSRDALFDLLGTNL